MSTKRIAELRRQFRKVNLDGYIITHHEYIRYLIDFQGFTMTDFLDGVIGMVVVTNKDATFFTDFRYKDEAFRQVKGAKVEIIKRNPIVSLKEYSRFNVKNRRYGFDPNALTISGRENLQKSVPDSILVPASEMFSEMGWVKDKEEIACIQKAAEISDIAFERILNMISSGVREKELAAELEYQMTMLGSERPAFETIIASGYRSALPHGMASGKRIKKGEFITFDFGATYKGYVSDMTRTVVVGKASPRQKKIYNLVLKAQKAAIRKVKAGVEGNKVDAAARNIIQKAGYGKNFGHGTGHGIGIFVHTGPSLSTISKYKLKVNNVITVEPGIYVSGWGGVRIEDDVVVTKTGSRILNKAPKNLLEL